jgi:hypothetical protein
LLEAIALDEWQKVLILDELLGHPAACVDEVESDANFLFMRLHRGWLFTVRWPDDNLDKACTFDRPTREAEAVVKQLSEDLAHGHSIAFEESRKRWVDADDEVWRTGHGGILRKTRGMS